MPCFRPNSWRSIVPSIHVVEESFQSYRVGEDEHFAARGPGDVLVGEAPREVDEVTGAGHELVVAARDGVAAPEHVERLVHVRMAVQRGAVSGWGAASDQGEVFARVHALASRYPPAEGMWRAVSGELRKPRGMAMLCYRLGLSTIRGMIGRGAAGSEREKLRRFTLIVPLRAKRSACIAGYAKE